MVQKRREHESSDAPPRKRRGRPRSYDPQTALTRAIKAFWRAGYTGTSLDTLSSATGMNRPSLYAAFGDKHDLYLRTLESYWETSRQVMHETLAYDRPVREALLQVYDKALDVYLPKGGSPRGCFAIGTATTEAVEHAKIRTSLINGLRWLDGVFEARLRFAKEQGDLPADADPKALAIMASAALHTLAIRSRAGETRAELAAIARAAVDVICGPRPLA